ncbi:MAG TPA: outer membrane lipoprotein chaperone LolA [Candidatus Acidoferrales bacterium]|nr:outer membrane lipoprotein chaperone LolA [Candidatus Acidoferrales bacterium]
MRIENLGFKVHNYALICVLLLVSSFAFAGDTPTAAEIVKNIRENFNQTHDVIIHFTQTVVMPLSKMSKVTDGTLYLKKGNKYRIETEDNVLVTDGKTSWTYAPSSKRIVVDNYKEDKNTISPDKFLLNVPSDFYVVLLSSNFSDADTTYTLRLTPKNDNSFIRSIKLVVSRNWTVRSAEISDMNDTRYTYTVKDLKINSGLPDSEFEFDPPKDAQIVDLRQH